jgi:hypothetical protein
VRAAADDARRQHDLVALFERGQEVLVVALLFAFGTNHQKVHDDDHGDERQDQTHQATAVGLTDQCRNVLTHAGSG